MSRTVFRTCTLCEAMCGLTFEVDGERIVSVGADEDDVFSHGFICPKGAAIAAVHEDPDRLRTPVRRTAAGDFEPISWEKPSRWSPGGWTRFAHGTVPTRSALYMGNPSSTTTARWRCATD